MPRREDIHPILLRVLAQWQGTARPKDVVAAVTSEFPELTQEDLARLNTDGAFTWTNRVHWARQDLVMQGLIDNSVRGVWSLTPQGLDRALDDTPVLQNPDHALAEDPPHAFGPDQPAVTILTSESEGLTEELVSAASDSSNPSRFEHALADALRFLGFDALEIGGSGQTDVLAVAPLGSLRYRVVLDAKSTSGKRVIESQINWLSLEQHRKDERAEHVAIVGTDFAGGQLQQRAEDFGISLLTVGELNEIVRLHASHPLTLVELRPAFSAAGRASVSIPELRAAAARRGRQMRLLLFLLKQIDHFNSVAPDDVIVKPETLWATTLSEHDLQGVSQRDVADALRLLELAGALSRSNGEGYVSQTSLEGSVQLLRAISMAAQGVPKLLATDDNSVNLESHGA